METLIRKRRAPTTAASTATDENRAPRHDGRPDFQCDKLRDSGADQKIHGEALYECKALPRRGRADDDTERHDPGRHRKPEAHSPDKTGPTGFVRRRFHWSH